MELFQMNNEGINASLMSPENMPYIRRAVGLSDYIIPGEDDRQKQYDEIKLLIDSEPIQMPPDPMMVQQAMMSGQDPASIPPVELPSIEPDLDVDDHLLEADICRRWLVSDAGRLCKFENELGYKNVLLHMKAHKDMDMQKQMIEMQKQMMMAPPMPPPPPGKEGNNGGGSAPKPPANNAGVPLGNDQNAPTIQ
jgi:hypothetical protein